MRKLKLICSVVCMIAMSCAGLSVSAALADPVPTDRDALDAYIRDYILNNPQVVRDALLKLEREEETANTKRVLGGLKGDLYQSGSPVLGNTDAKISIVEFYDYNCPYCRATYSQLKGFLASNPDVKIVLKDIASLGKVSEAVSRVVIAATKQGKFAEIHDALMTLKGQVTETRALEVAEKLGVDIERLKKDARSSETGDTLTRAQDLATRLNVTITPLYIIGHKGIAGAPEDLLTQIEQNVAEIRKNGCDVC